MSSWTELRKRFARSYNIESPQWAPPVWEAGQELNGLNSLREYAENYVECAIRWYYLKKAWKARASQATRSVVLLATGLGGLIPIISSTILYGNVPNGLQTQLRILQVNQFGYLCFALGAVLFAFDKYFGYSTGWMRYISTAAALETALLSFRLDWTKKAAQMAGTAPSGVSLDLLIQTIHGFCIASRTLVESETQAWVMEFQSNLSQLERESKVALENARTKAEALRQDAEEKGNSLRPGAIELTVHNATETDHGFDIFIDGVIHDSNVSNLTIGVMKVSPGLRQIDVKATIGGVPAHAVQISTVVADAVQKINLTLAKTRVARA